MVTLATKKVVAIIVSFGGADGLERWAGRMSELLKQYAVGRDIEIQVIQ
jgi:hypothetical protein